MINLDNIDAVDKWIDLHYQVVWSILFVLAGVRLRRNRKAPFLLSYSHSHCLLSRLSWLLPKGSLYFNRLKKFFLTQFFLRISNTTQSVLKTIPLFIMPTVQMRIRSKFHFIMIPFNVRIKITNFRRHVHV